MDQRFRALLLSVVAGFAPHLAHAQPVPIPVERSVSAARKDLGNGVCITAVHVQNPPPGQVPFSSVDDALAALNQNSTRLLEDGRVVLNRSLINYRNNDPLAGGDFGSASLFAFSDNPGATPPSDDRNFALRVRGYLNVVADNPLQLQRTIGLYADDGARLTIGGARITMPDVDQRMSARRVRQIEFAGSGLYPFELVYYQNGSLAVLELSQLDEWISENASYTNLSDVGFRLLGEPRSNLFVNTELYTSPHPGLPMCVECATDSACPQGSYCARDFGPGEPSGLCQQCNASDRCGADCQACDAATPMCSEGTCVQCVSDADCVSGSRCDAASHSCQEALPNWLYLGGCSAAPMSAAGQAAGGWLHAAGALMLLSFLLRRPRRPRSRIGRGLGLGLLVTGLCALAPRAARADLSVNTQTFKPATSPDSIITVEGTRSDLRLRPMFNVLVEYSHRPLRLVDGNTGMTLVNTVPEMLSVHLMAGMGLTRWLSVAAALPVVVSQGFDPATPALDVPSAPSPYGVGDLRLVTKMRIVNNDRGGFGLAFVPQVTFPTGDAYQLRGDDAYGLEPRLAVDYRSPGGVVIALNMGFLGRTSNQIVRSMEVGSQVRYGLGLALPIGQGFALLGELAGGTSLTRVPDGVLYSPLETHVGARWTHSSGLTLSVGTGTGLTPAVGSPQYRMFASVGYLPIERRPTPGTPVMSTPLPRPAPPVPTAAEPPRSTITVEKAGDGTGQVISEPGGISCGKVCNAPFRRDEEVRLTAIPEKGSRFAGWEGPCTGLQPCTVVVRGEPRLKAHFIKSQVVITETKLDLQGNVIHFETGKSKILIDSFYVLDEVALILKMYPKMHLRIEGHADSVPFRAPGGNLQLSRDRAAAVVQYLIDHGIMGARLSSEGFGDTCPVATNLTVEGRQSNRRTEFLLVDPQTGRYERTPCVAYTAAPRPRARSQTAAQHPAR